MCQLQSMAPEAKAAWAKLNHLLSWLPGGSARNASASPPAQLNGSSSHSSSSSSGGSSGRAQGSPQTLQPGQAAALSSSSGAPTPSNPIAMLTAMVAVANAMKSVGVPKPGADAGSSKQQEHGGP